ncbi:MAG: DUF1285 domain-containing protein [Asticcacaulis sp.]
MNDWLSEATRFPEKIWPVEDWHPRLCGAIDIRIQSDGVWLHEGRPIGRTALVRLFSRLLRHDEDGYVLVTPVEKLTIHVDDLPFRIVDFDIGDAGEVVFVTGQEDRVILGEAHPLIIDVMGEEWRPRLKVRGNLWGRLTRACAQRLFETADLSADGRAVQVQFGTQAFEIPVISS